MKRNENKLIITPEKGGISRIQASSFKSTDIKDIQIFDKESGLAFDLRSEGEMVSLTDLWKAAGSPNNNEIKDWLRLPQTETFINIFSKLQKVEKSHLLKIKRGKGGGTWAHRQIALEYAQYLDPKLAVLVNQIFFERIEEEKNPDLIMDRAVSTYKRKGKDEKWISKRLEGKIKRNAFTSTLAAHGVQHEGFRNCTNNIYTPLFGGGSNVVRLKKGLLDNVNIRDNLSGIELEAVKFAEALADEKITQQRLYGNAKCEEASLTASSIVAKGVKDFLGNNK